uniref:Secreted protein n=1 Tax=Globodera pallida TaxID=36090 RepID=A0A183BTR2_GLOPA
MNSSKCTILLVCAALAVLMSSSSVSVDAQWYGGWPYYGSSAYYGATWPSYGGYYGGYYGKRQAGFEPVQQPVADSIGGGASGPIPRPPSRPFSDAGVDHQGQFKGAAQQ